MDKGNTYFVLGKERRIVVNPDVGNMVLGATSVAIPPRMSVLVPLTLVQFPLETLSFVSLILTEFKQYKVKPRLHIWDRDKPHPEFSICFSIEKPDRGFLTTLIPAQSRVIMKHAWSELRLLITVRFPRTDIIQFLEMFDTCKAVAIYVSEFTATEPRGARVVQAGELTPLHVFTLFQIESTKPHAIL